MNGEAMAEEVAELGDLKVMVIDDSKTIRRTAETLLKKAGCDQPAPNNSRERADRLPVDDHRGQQAQKPQRIGDEEKGRRGVLALADQVPPDVDQGGNQEEPDRDRTHLNRAACPRT